MGIIGKGGLVIQHKLIISIKNYELVINTKIIRLYLPLFLNKNN